MTAAIVLGGGRATRLDGADKASIVVDGARLVDHVFAAVADCPQVIAVGPDTLVRPGVTVVREDPPFGGPVAGIAAAVQTVDCDDVWLLACDLPRAVEIVRRLADEPIGDDDGVILVDATGRAQWLAGRYRTAALRSSLTRIGDAHGASMRQLVNGLNLRTVHDRTGAAADLDTWADVADYRLRTKGQPMTDTQPPNLDAWIADLSRELGLGDVDVPVRELLDLTREVAHGVARPAGPISTFLVGLAVARGSTVTDAQAAVSALIEARA
ncbi:Molybdopterin-guanine dinucleotide biosynthesis protein A [Gordonia malaquae]|uniref:Uncharacterized protein n=1 Tax=Gordonia malaquae NBRC 108250 TaxID=1223542 RepID=M3VDK2_GORML|nr:NTP transferase domain-containing protein [Gordonia malaquae]GAC78549.1 hypothetical protein GM1_003_02880 [Gordonia malaquae NBRC 108250]SED44734.1 Molybdopterin-guanine dinucleotide biosynthesis protein A [Gordonia malaquae]